MCGMYHFSPGFGTPCAACDEGYTTIDQGSSVCYSTNINAVVTRTVHCNYNKGLCESGTVCNMGDEISEGFYDYTFDGEYAYGGNYEDNPFNTFFNDDFMNNDDEGPSRRLISSNAICESCKVGHICIDGMHSWACLAGYGTGSESSTDCVPCGEGQYSTVGSGCLTVPAGLCIVLFIFYILMHNF